MAATSSVAAAQSPGRFEITPFGAMSFGGSFEDLDQDTGEVTSADLDDGASFGLVLNLRESANTQWEVIYSRQATDVDTRQAAFAAPSLDVELEYLQFGGTYIGEGQRIRPYVAASIGGTRISPDVANLGDDTFWSASIGAGLRAFPERRIGLRLEARVWGTLLDSNTDLFCSSGSQGGVCAVAVDGDALWQFTTFAGVVFRF